MSLQMIVNILLWLIAGAINGIGGQGPVIIPLLLPHVDIILGSVKPTLWWDRVDLVPTELDTMKSCCHNFIDFTLKRAQL